MSLPMSLIINKVANLMLFCLFVLLGHTRLCRTIEFSQLSVRSTCFLEEILFRVSSYNVRFEKILWYVRILFHSDTVIVIYFFHTSLRYLFSMRPDFSHNPHLCRWWWCKWHCWWWLWWWWWGWWRWWLRWWRWWLWWWWHWAMHPSLLLLFKQTPPHPPSTLQIFKYFRKPL